MNPEEAQVLIVEDEPNMALLLQEELEDEGYLVTVVYEGNAALKSINESTPAVVILDINMPGKDGIETLNSIVSAYGDLPVILHTAYSAYKDNYMTWAAVDYIVKSTDLTELIQAVARAVSANEKGV